MKKIAILMLIGVSLIGCSSNYSDGFRVGIVRKFSYKGAFIKSWEGELLLGGVVSTGGETPTLVNETFDFSIDPELRNNEDYKKIIKDLNFAAESGVRTKIYYIQNTIPKIRTETSYFVQKVELLKDSK